MTSGQGQGPMPGELAYAATKGAVEAFTTSVAPTLAARGITINAVNPGPTDTGWMNEELKAILLPQFPDGADRRARGCSAARGVFVQRGCGVDYRSGDEFGRRFLEEVKIV